MTKNSLALENLRVPTFYTSPNFHKQRNPGRPVIKSTNSHKSIFMFVRSLITTTCTKKLLSYVKYTPEVI